MQIGRYEVEGELARGGMGVVHIGIDPRMKRKVAIKVLKDKYSADEEIRKRFEREVEAIAALEHPNIAPVYDFGDSGGQLYFVMRYLPGGTLRDRLRAKPLSLRDLAPVLTRVAEALDFAHDHDVLHRDIKPANVLFGVRERGRGTLVPEQAAGVTAGPPA